MSRELLYRKLLKTQQQIAEEKRRRLELFTEVVINIFVGTGARLTIDDLKARLQTCGEEKEADLKLIWDKLVDGKLIEYNVNGVYSLKVNFPISMLTSKTSMGQSDTIGTQ